MVLFFPIIAAIPTVIGVSEGISHQRRDNNAASMTEAEKEAEREQMRKFTLECYCEGKGKRAREIHGGKVVLRGGKVGLDFSPQSWRRGWGEVSRSISLSFQYQR